MNALTTGGLIILYLLLVNAFAAYIQEETVPSFAEQVCSNGGENTTVCRDSSETSFVSTVLDVSVSGIDGAPVWFNGFWVGINAFLLVLAIILIVSFFIGLFFGGAA